MINDNLPHGLLIVGHVEVADRKLHEVSLVRGHGEGESLDVAG